MQSGVIVNDQFIEGTLKYVTGYTGYSGAESEQEGNYLALKFTGTEGASCTVELLGSGHGPVELDSDMNCVFRITSTSQKIRLTATKDGETVTKTFRLGSLKLEPKAD